MEKKEGGRVWGEGERREGGIIIIINNNLLYTNGLT